MDRKVLEVARENPTDGSRMVATLTARELDLPVNRKRAQRLMREHRLLQPKRSEGRRKRPGYFEVTRPDELWHMDMTSVWVAEHGWCYLNAAIDCCTLADARRFFESEDEESSGPPPVDFANGFESGTIEGGKQQVVDLDLKAGSYVLVCFLPDRAGGPPHAAKGMSSEGRSAGSRGDGEGRPLGARRSPSLQDCSERADDLRVRGPDRAGFGPASLTGPVEPHRDGSTSPQS